MTIFWSGYGLLTILLYFAGAVLATGLENPIGRSAALCVGLGLGGAANWLVGRHVNRRWNEHTLFAIPMQYWGALGVVAAAVGLVLRIFGLDPAEWWLQQMQ